MDSRLSAPVATLSFQINLLYRERRMLSATLVKLPFQLIFPTTILNGIAHLTTLQLTMVMVGLGLNVNLNELRSKALRPFVAMLITSILLSVITFFTIVEYLMGDKNSLKFCVTIYGK